MTWKLHHRYFLGVWLLSLFLFLSPLKTNANTFPNDAKSAYFSVQGVTNMTVATGTIQKPYTILGVSMQQSNVASDTYLKCGTVTLAHNTATTLNFIPLSYVCNDVISLSKTGNDVASVIVTYVEYNLASSTSTTTSTTTSAAYNGPNFQEWLFVACVFLFFISLGTWRRILSPFLTPVR